MQALTIRALTAQSWPIQSFDDASFDGVKKRGYVARRIHIKFYFKFYIDLPRTLHAPRRGRNSALNLPRAATLPPFTTLPHITGGRQARLNLPHLNAGSQILPEICRRSLALYDRRQKFRHKFQKTH